MDYEIRLARLQKQLVHPDSATADLPSATAMLRKVQVKHHAAPAQSASQRGPSADTLVCQLIWRLSWRSHWQWVAPTDAGSAAWQAAIASRSSDWLPLTYST